MVAEEFNYRNEHVITECIFPYFMLFVILLNVEHILYCRHFLLLGINSLLDHSQKSLLHDLSMTNMIHVVEKPTEQMVPSP